MNRHKFELHKRKQNKMYKLKNIQLKKNSVIFHLETPEFTLYILYRKDFQHIKVDSDWDGRVCGLGRPEYSL